MTMMAGGVMCSRVGGRHIDHDGWWGGLVQGWWCHNDHDGWWGDVFQGWWSFTMTMMAGGVGWSRVDGRSH